MQRSHISYIYQPRHFLSSMDFSGFFVWARWGDVSDSFPGGWSIFFPAGWDSGGNKPWSCSFGPPFSHGEVWIFGVLGVGGSVKYRSIADVLLRFTQVDGQETCLWNQTIWWRMKASLKGYLVVHVLHALQVARRWLGLFGNLRTNHELVCYTM